MYIKSSHLFLQTNGKLESSSIYTYAFNLPAVSTCPGAGICREYCFASAEQKRHPSAMAHRQQSLELSKSIEFIATITAELSKLRNRHIVRNTDFAIRIHASGDFYSMEYIRNWFRIMEAHPNIQFYAYTKSIALMKRIGYFPANFICIYSEGGNQDALIDTQIDRHARIFGSEQLALDAGYTLANEDDAAAWQSTSNKIGLVIFGAIRKWGNISQIAIDSNK